MDEATETAPAEAPKLKTYTKGAHNKYVVLALSYKSYPGVTFEFTVERQRKRGQDADAQNKAIRSDEEFRAEWLARWVVAPPKGFDGFEKFEDFDTENATKEERKALADTIRAYFSDPDEPWLLDIAEDVQSAYWRTLLPESFF